MTKEALIEPVFIRINGGVLTPESSVMRVDIEAYIPAVVNFFLTKGYFIQQKEEQNRDIPTSFYTHFNNIPVLKDSTRKDRPYIEIPGTLIPLPSNRALRMILDNMDTPYTPLNDNHLSNLDYWLNILQDERFYRLEGRKIFLYNKPKPVEKMNVVMIVTVEELAMDAELPIPAGSEADAITMLYEFATGIRTIPADKKADAQDIN